MNVNMSMTFENDALVVFVQITGSQGLYRMSETSAAEIMCNAIGLDFLRVLLLSTWKIKRAENVSTLRLELQTSFDNFFRDAKETK